LTEKISLLVADEHQLLRDAISVALMCDPDFTVSTAGTLEELNTKAGEADPIDIILLNLNISGVDGLTTLQDLVERHPNSAIVLLSAEADPEFVAKAIDLGVRGLVPKSLPFKSLSNTLRLIKTGEVFLPISFLNRSNMLSYSEKTTGAERKSKLSTKELGVLRYVTSGKTNKEIAWEVGLSEVTIKMHMRSICMKLNARNRTHAAMLARQMQLL
jgi:two-component system, NarL family, nitrate/nitrite response regulator NarL